MRSKKIIKAGLKKLILFVSEDECEKHLKHLTDRKIRYRILEKRTNDDDTVSMVLVEQYNNVELLV